MSRYRTTLTYLTYLPPDVLAPKFAKAVSDLMLAAPILNENEYAKFLHELRDWIAVSDSANDFVKKTLDIAIGKERQYPAPMDGEADMYEGWLVQWGLTKPKKTLMVCGPAGSGKSSLIRHLQPLLPELEVVEATPEVTPESTDVTTVVALVDTRLPHSVSRGVPPAHPKNLMYLYVNRVEDEIEDSVWKERAKYVANWIRRI